MTESEARYCLKAGSELHPEVCEECPLYGQTGTDHCREDALDMAMQALEKQIPKNIANKQKSECPEDVETYGEYAIFGRCPVCKSLQNIMWNNEYCGNCGQHIDWRNEG